MNLHLVVNGLIARDSLLRRLLLNYADRFPRGIFGGPTTAPGFIVPTWTANPRPSAPPGSELLVVEAHVFRGDPCCYLNLEATLQLLHAVLVDADASRPITIRCLGTSADVMESGLDTLFKVATWEIAPPPAQYPTVAQPRLLPWPCPSELTSGGSPASGIDAINLN
jgi:hypothetical protein